MSAPLEGVRVLDLSTLVQGPQAAMMLGTLGAEVIKIELPDIGDMGRHVDHIERYGHTSVFVANNRGKRSVALDLRVPTGREAFLKLVEGADVVISNFAPGTMEGWQLGYDDMAAVNPRIVWATGSFLGPKGSDATREGADMVGQAYGGIISTSGYDNGPVSPVATLVADHCGSQNMQTGILAALLARETSGRGQRVDVSLLGGQIWLQATEYTHFFMTGEESGRSNGGHPLVPALYGVFPTADGHIAIAGCPEHLWPGMCRAVERPDLAEHPTFSQYFVSHETAAEMREVFLDIFRHRTTAEWSERLEAEGQRFGKVRSHSEVAVDPQAFDNGYLFAAEFAGVGDTTFIGSPITFSDTPAVRHTDVAVLGQHTEEVLVEAGYSWDDLERLREGGAW